mmetsp:Transcript_5777/g.11906  ORF Transcript_5777/g.11906 Transcript_5777/m.11906 type:complete len:210 (+) Transcript_5777:487-1116(+)
MELNGIKGSHFHVIELRVSIHVDAVEPIPNRNFVRFVFLGQHEINKLLVRKIFPVNVVLLKRSWCRIEYSVHNHVGKRVISVFQQIFPRDAVVPVVVEFPKAAIQDIEMFVTEISRHFVDVFLFVHERKGFKEIGSSNLPGRDSSRVAFVYRIKNACNDSDCVFLLKLGVVGQKFQTRMIIEESFDVWQKIISENAIFTRLFDKSEKAF